MTYLVLTDETKKVIPISRIKLASLDPNLRLDGPDGNDEGDEEDPGEFEDTLESMTPSDPGAR
jgi:hypothetical protein